MNFVVRNCQGKIVEHYYRKLTKLPYCKDHLIDVSSFYHEVHSSDKNFSHEKFSGKARDVLAITGN